MISAQQVVSPAFRAFVQRVRCLKIHSLVDQLDRSPVSQSWTEEEKVRTITRYFAFLYLADFYADLALIPPRNIAHVWRCHALDRQQYLADCQLLLDRVPVLADGSNSAPYLTPDDRPADQQQEIACFQTQMLFHKHFGCSIGAASALFVPEPL